MSKDQVASEFKWVSGGGNELQLLGHPHPDSGASADQETISSCHFEFLREGYLYMIEEERDHLPHGIYASSLSPRSPTAISNSAPTPVVGGAHAVLIRRTSDPAIKVIIIIVNLCWILSGKNYSWILLDIVQQRFSRIMIKCRVVSNKS